MKKLLLCFVIPFLLCGCTHDMSRKEIDEINLVLVLGIDYSDGEYTVSALYSTGGGADPEKGAGSGEENVAKGTGKTPYEALEDLKLKDKKSISIAQVGSFLIGDGAAKNGLKQSIDFLSRDETIKMEALLYVIKDKSASDFMEEGIEKKQSIHEDLQAIEQKQRELLTRSDNTLVNILNDMKQTYSCVLIPSLTAEESGFLIDGYAVFDDLKLSEYLDKETSNGINFIKNTIRSYSIYLENEVGLQISYTNTKLKADVKNSNITIKIKMDFETMMKEIITDKNIFNQKELSRLTQKQNDYIKAILEKPVNYSKEKGLDILNLARIVENQNVPDWADIEKSWDEKISDIEYVFDLNSKITKSFILGSER